MLNPIPPDEPARLAELLSYEILDTEPEKALDDLVALVAELCEVPTAMISLIDERRQWMKAKTGSTTIETPREIAFCSHAICESDVLVVSDATADERFARNPLVTGDPNIRFYAGAPLISPAGFALGTLCVIDSEPRELKPEQKRILSALSRHVVTQLELRRAFLQRRKAEEALTRAHAELEQKVQERTATLNGLLERVRKEDADRLQQEETAHRRSEQLLCFEAALLKLATTPHPDLDSALSQITEVAALTLDVNCADVWLFENARSELRCRETFTMEGEREISGDPVSAAEFAQWLSELTNRFSIAVHDCAEEAGTRAIARTLETARGTKSLLVAPIRLRGEVVGIVTHAQTTGPRRWSKDEQDFAGFIAGTVALALEAEERRKLVLQLHALAAHLEKIREEERTGLARELHDELGQLLTALRMDVAWMGKNLESRPDIFPVKAPQRLAAMKELIDQAIASVQRISSELRPGILEDLGLTAALSHQVREFEERCGIQCQFEPPEREPTVDRNRATAIYRTFQEALTNVARHAEATEVRVCLCETRGNLILEVRDNGRGLPPEATEDAASLGLIGMRERALSLSGETVFQSQPGQGTSVKVTIPLV